MTKVSKFQFRILTAQSSVLELGLPISYRDGLPIIPFCSHALALSCTPRGLAHVLSMPIPSWTLGYAHWCCFWSLEAGSQTDTWASLARGLGAIWAGNSRIWRLSSERQTWLQVGTRSRWVHPPDRGEGKATCYVRRWGHTGPLSPEQRVWWRDRDGLFTAPSVEHVLINCID